jgi:hypothetical protein
MESGAQGAGRKAQDKNRVVSSRENMGFNCFSSGFWLLDSLMADSHLAVTGSY